MSDVKVLVTTDGSNLSEQAVDTAVKLAKALGGSLVGVTVVVAPPPAGGFECEDPAVRERLTKISDKAREGGVECEIVAEHAGTVWEGILECAPRCGLHRHGEPRLGLLRFASSRQRNAEGSSSGGPPGSGCSLNRNGFHLSAEASSPRGGSLFSVTWL